jgi:hypothetical protein
MGSRLYITSTYMTKLEVMKWIAVYWLVAIVVVNALIYWMDHKGR